MPGIIASIEEDDDGTTAMKTTRHKRRLVVESDPEDLFDVPDGMGPNPLAPSPVKKKQRRQLPLVAKQNDLRVPPLSLQPPMPAQNPPRIQSYSVPPSQQMEPDEDSQHHHQLDEDERMQEPEQVNPHPLFEHEDDAPQAASENELVPPYNESQIQDAWG